MKTNLYTATGSWATGQTNQMDYVQLLSTPAADLLANGLSDPYLMGYIEHDKMPGFCRVGHPVNDGKIFHVDYVEENHGWGFCTLTNGGWFAHAMKQNGTLLVASNNLYARFINSGTMASANYDLKDNDNIILNITFVCEPLEYADDNAIYSASDSGVKFASSTTYSWTIPWGDVLNAIVNNGDLTLTINNIFGVNRTFKIKSNSHNDYNLFSAVDDLNEVKIYFHIKGINTIAQITQYTRADLSTSDNLYMFPFFQSSFISDSNSALDPDIKIMTGMLNTRSYGDLRLRYDSSTELFIVTWNNFRVFDRYFVGYIPYDVKLQEILDANTTQATPFISGNTGIILGKFIFKAVDSSGSFDIYTSYTFNDIYNLVFLLHKHTISSGETNAELYTYAGKAHVSLFDTANKPLYVYEDGTATDPDFLSKLQPWQYPEADITINEFKPEDVPEYNPPGDEGEDGDGDNILPPILSGIGDLTGFVTMYALKANQLANLGSQLWASFTDPDFWNSVSVVLSDTTSIDPAVILNYIVSIRLYPFDLATVDGASDELPEIFFGRGLAGVLVDTNLAHKIYTLNQCVTRVDGGVLRVPAKYGDFRDMEPCAKMVLHVPFAGSCEINPSQVVGKYLTLSYSIDYCTGAFMAQCFVSGDGLPMSYPVATLYGQLGATVQLSASNEMESLQCLAGATLGIATGAMNGIAGAISGAMGVATSLSNNRALPHTTGKSSGFSSFYEPRVPYIEIIYDKYYVPDNYGHVHGYACNTTSKIGDLHGYTVCRNVDTTGLSCETDERLSIKQILESGFYVD